MMRQRLNGKRPLPALLLLNRKHRLPALPFPRCKDAMRNSIRRRKPGACPLIKF